MQSPCTNLTYMKVQISEILDLTEKLQKNKEPNVILASTILKYYIM